MLFSYRYVTQAWKQVIEAVIVALTTTAVAFTLIYSISDCQALGKDKNKNPLQVCTYLISRLNDFSEKDWIGQLGIILETSCYQTPPAAGRGTLVYTILISKLIVESNKIYAE